MATAVSLNITAQAVEDDMVKLSLYVLYYDQSLGVLEQQPVYVKFSPSASVGVIENTIEAAIIDQARSYYPTMVLVPSDIIMLDIKKGT